LVHTSAVEVAHVGDSRAYFIRNGHIWPLTKDHSVVQQMLDQGAITPEQAVLHPEGNKITRALGMKPDTDVELRDPPLLQAVGDIFILASDGLCDLVRTEEIGPVVLQAASLDLAGQNLVAMANARGGHDNITVMLARVLPGGAAGAGGGQEPVAPTIVEQSIVPVPDKTLIDHPHGPLQPAVPIVPHTPQPHSPHGDSPHQGAHAPAPRFVPPQPSGPALAPPAQASHAPITAPLAISDLPAAARPAPPATIPPAPPSRGGLILGLSVLMLLLLGGVAVWWILRGH
jgi:hypothetical protein